MSIRIGIIGPESSGKSVLGAALAAHYGGVYVPEYAREYAEQAGTCDYDDVCRILERDRADMLAHYDAPYVFLDAGLIIDKVWLDVVFGQRPEWLTDSNGAIPEELRADFYLLTRPDLRWVADPTRENGSDEARERLYDIYLEEIIRTGRPYGIVFGEGEARTLCAIRHINRYHEEHSCR